jgi:hypothetical protein
MQQRGHNDKNNINLNMVNFRDALALGDEHSISPECRRWSTPLNALDWDEIIVG